MRVVIILVVIGLAWLLLKPEVHSPVYVMATVTPQAQTAAIHPAPNEAPVRIVMPAIGLDAAIVPSPPDIVPETAVGWWDSPDRGDVVLYGHNYGVFSPLVNVQVGQAVTIDNRQYTVTNIYLLPPDGVIPAPFSGLILITCWPFPNGTAERLIVEAR